MVRRSERDLSLCTAERLAGGLPIAVRLRIGIELLRALAAGPPAVAMPRSSASRLAFERVVLRADGGVSVKGDGDDSGAALVLWEVLAGRPLGSEPPVRLHDIVDDMPADTDDLVMGAVRPGGPPATTTELFEELVRVAESYAVAQDALWDQLPSGAPSSRKGRAAAPTSTRTAPASTRAAPTSTRAAPAGEPAPEATPSKTAATLPSMKAVVPPKRAAPPVTIAEPPTPPLPASQAPELAVMLIHAGDERQSLANALRRAGYPVVACGDAASALARAERETPICVVCDADLPDADGQDLARRFRKLATAAADTPFVLFASQAEADRAVPRFRAGADVYLAKPIASAALVRQIGALIDMSSRLRSVHRAVPSARRAPEAAAVTGDIRQIGIAAMLTLLEMEKRTGSFIATSEAWAPTSAPATLAAFDPNSMLELELARGCVAGARSMGVPARPIEVVRAMMRLTAGRFSFKPAEPRDVDAPSLRELLTEAARREDEEAAGHS
jgi:CheY-like chemotaxis protein